MSTGREQGSPGSRTGRPIRIDKGSKQLEKLSQYELDAVILLVKFEISNQKQRGDLLGEVNARTWEDILNKLKPQKII